MSGSFEGEVEEEGSLPLLAIVASGFKYCDEGCGVSPSLKKSRKTGGSFIQTIMEAFKVWVVVSRPDMYVRLTGGDRIPKLRATVAPNHIGT